MRCVAMVKVTVIGHNGIKEGGDNMERTVYQINILTKESNRPIYLHYVDTYNETENYWRVDESDETYLSGDFFEGTFTECVEYIKSNYTFKVEGR